MQSSYRHKTGKDFVSQCGKLPGKCGKPGPPARAAPDGGTVCTPPGWAARFGRYEQQLLPQRHRQPHEQPQDEQPVFVPPTLPEQPQPVFVPPTEPEPEPQPVFVPPTEPEQPQPHPGRVVVVPPTEPEHEPPVVVPPTEPQVPVRNSGIRMPPVRPQPRREHSSQHMDDAS